VAKEKARFPKIKLAISYDIYCILSFVIASRTGIFGSVNNVLRAVASAFRLDARMSDGYSVSGFAG
jgi:hypothetical protein